jgi:predicted nucleic acid-binding protein
MSVFLDSNILLYALSNAPDHLEKRHTARQLISRQDWLLSAQVLQEFYANIIKPKHGLPKATATAFIEEIALSRSVCPIDVSLVRQAIDVQVRFQLSYWDAAIVAAALRMGARILMSEDLNHGQNYDGVTVQNPFVGH